MAAATTKLSPDHPPIAYVQFHYGSACAPWMRCPVGDPRTTGHVIFGTSQFGPQPELIVIVVADEDGAITTVSNPQPYPWIPPPSARP